MPDRRAWLVAWWPLDTMSAPATRPERTAVATTASTTRSLGERSRLPLAYPVLLGLLCVSAGVSLALAAAGHLADLGGSAPYVHSLVAFNEPATADLTDVFGPAAKSVDNLTFFLTIGATAVAAALLIVATGFFWSSGHVRHPDAARRVAAVGLTMALAIAMVTVIPFDAGWGEALGSTGGTTVEAVRTGVVALLGLLVLQLSAPQWRESVREAFRD
ncbi:MAG: hypothetical protein V9E98_07215 [Candidatus Nanopelagicales bacterium]